MNVLALVCVATKDFDHMPSQHGYHHRTCCKHQRKLKNILRKDSGCLLEVFVCNLKQTVLLFRVAGETEGVFKSLRRDGRRSLNPLSIP
jgi:hypothetical protein